MIWSLRVSAPGCSRYLREPIRKLPAPTPSIGFASAILQPSSQIVVRPSCTRDSPWVDRLIRSLASRASDGEVDEGGATTSTAATTTTAASARRR